MKSTEGKVYPTYGIGLRPVQTPKDSGIGYTPIRDKSRTPIWPEGLEITENTKVWMPGMLPVQEPPFNPMLNG